MRANQVFQEFLKKIQDSGSSSSKRTGKCGTTNGNLLQELKKFLIRTSIINPRKTNTDLRRYLLDYGVKISTLLKLLKFVLRQFLSQKMMKKNLARAKKYRSWTVNDWKKMLFNDQTHLFVQRYKSKVVRWSEAQTLGLDHMKQTIKHLSKHMFLVFPQQMAQEESMMNSVKYIEIFRSRIVPSIKTFDPDFYVGK